VLPTEVLSVQPTHSVPQFLTVFVILCTFCIWNCSGLPFPTADVIENIRRNYEIYSESLPVCTVVKAVRTMCNSGCDTNPHSQFFDCTCKV
jgi:hypothetical protein